jgi:serine/threonine-protein kinase
VLVRETDLGVIPPTLNPRLAELLQRCLQKNPKRRWQTASDVREEIEIIKKNPRTSALLVGTAAPRPLWRRAIPVLITALVSSAIAAAVASTLKRSVPAQVARFAIVLPEGQNFTRTRSQVVAISPDGSTIAYVADQQLYVRRIGEFEAQPVPGTREDVGGPFFSPDGGWIGFYSFSDSAVKKVPVGGGAPVVLCTGCTNTLGFGVDWAADTIVFSRGGQEIVKVPATGGKPEVWVKAGAGETLSSPQILPGNRLMFSVLTAGTTWDQANIVVLTAAGERKILIRGGSGARYVPTGHLVYSVDGDVFAVPVDLDEVSQNGDPVLAAKATFRSRVPFGSANFDISDNGTLMYALGSESEAEGLRVVTIADRAGKTRPIPGLAPGAYTRPRVSPDGRQLAVETLDDASIAIYDLSGKNQLRRLTLEGNNQMPVWSPDSTRVAFRSVRDGQAGLFIQKADGSEPAERLTTMTAGFEAPLAWAADNRIVFGRDNRVWLFSLKNRQIEPLPDQPREGSNGGNVSVSRDGVWMAVAISSGQPPGFRIFMRQFPAGATYPVSRELANQPVWAHDGRELFYFQGETRRLVSVRIEPPPAFSVRGPSVIPIPSMYQPEGDLTQFDVLPDGRFLILQPAPQDNPTARRTTQQIQVVMNWRDELSRIAPPRR